MGRKLYDSGVVLLGATVAVVSAPVAIGLVLSAVAARDAWLDFRTWWRS